MGLTNGNYEKKTYLSIVAGKLAQKVTKETEGAITRYSEKAKKDMHEIYHDKLSGTITGLKIETKEFDGGKSKQLDITVSDVGEKYIVSLPVESKFFDSFCSKIKSADMKSVLTLSPYAFQDKEGKKVSGMNIFQNDAKLPYYYSKEEPKGRPTADGHLEDDEYKIHKLKERKFYQEEMEKLNAEMQTTPAKTEEPTLAPGIEPLPF